VPEKIDLSDEEASFEELQFVAKVGPARAGFFQRGKQVLNHKIISVALGWLVLAVAVGMLAIMVPEKVDTIIFVWPLLSVVLAVLAWLDRPASPAVHIRRSRSRSRTTPEIPPRADRQDVA